jgi:subtilisin family serine protease
VAVVVPVAIASASSKSGSKSKSSDPPSAAAAQVAGTGNGKTSTAPEYVPGRLIVKFKDSVDACIDCRLNDGRSLAPALGSAGVDRLNRRYGVKRARPILARDAKLRSKSERQRLHARNLGSQKQADDLTSTYVLQLSPSADVEQAATAFERDPKVDYAQPDGIRKTSSNDTYFASSGAWGQSFDDLWGLKKVKAPDVWGTTTGSGVVVAVSDTGVDYAHPDLAANIWSNPGEIAGNSLDDDNNGYVDDTRGWDFSNGDNDPTDDYGHGTHVAGTIAAVANNGIGIAGVAPGAKIMPVKGLDSNGSGTDATLVQTIVYATENNADVINASWGGPYNSPAEDSAIAAANAAGTTVVVAAGNSSTNVGTSSPAGAPDAITVAAADHNDQRAYFSNYGEKIDVTAPGGGDGGAGTYPERSILSLKASQAGSAVTNGGALVVGSGYLRQAGTSMSSPHVAGVAALVKQAHPSYTPDQIRQALRTGADDVDGPGFDLGSGYGRVNAQNAVNVVPPVMKITGPARYLDFGSGTTQTTISGKATGSAFSSYTLEYGAGNAPTSWTPIGGTSTTPVNGGALGVWTFGAAADGLYTIRLRVQSTSGAFFEDRLPVTLDRLPGASAPFTEGFVRSGISGQFSLKVPWPVNGSAYLYPDIASRWSSTRSGNFAAISSFEGCPLVALGRSTFKTLAYSDSVGFGSGSCESGNGMHDAMTDDIGRNVVFMADYPFQPGASQPYSPQVFIARRGAPVIQVTNLDPQGRTADEPAISGDGKTVIYRSDSSPTGQNADGNNEVFAYTIATQQVTQVTHTSGCDSGGGGLSISRDGNRIAMRSTCNFTGANLGGDTRPFVFDRAQNRYTQLAGCEKGNCYAADSVVISKDGNRVVNYDVSGFGFTSKVWMVVHTLDGSTDETKTDTYGPLLSGIDTSLGEVYLLFSGSNEPSISANGKRISFAAKFNPFGKNDDGHLDVFVLDYGVNADGSSKMTQITDVVINGGYGVSSLLSQKGDRMLTYIGAPWMNFSSARFLRINLKSAPK